MRKSLNDIFKQVVDATRERWLKEPPVKYPAGNGTYGSTLSTSGEDGEKPEGALGPVSGNWHDYPYFNNILKANGGEMPLHFYPATVDEITRQFALLSSKTGSQFKYKFPCVLLVLDTPIEYGKNELPTAVVDIAIVTQSNAEWPSYERDVKVFRTVLRPIAEALLAEIRRSKYFQVPTRGLSYTYVERFNTSADLMKEAIKIYGASCDAIELIQMQLNLRNLEC